MLVFVLWRLDVAQPSLRGRAGHSMPALLGQNSSAKVPHRRTGATDGTVVNPTCVDYTIEGYFPARNVVLSTGLPPAAGEQVFVDRPATLSVCELEQLHHDCVNRINMYRSGLLKFSDGSEDAGGRQSPGPFKCTHWWGTVLQPPSNGRLEHHGSRVSMWSLHLWHLSLWWSTWAELVLHAWW